MLSSPPFETSLASNHHIELPSESVAPFIEKNMKRVKVTATFQSKTIEFHAALIKHHSGVYRMSFSAAKQKELGVFANDFFRVHLFEDTSKYGVEMSEELNAVLLSDYDAYQIFEALTPGRQRSIIYAIARYKTSQTRIDNALILTENLKRGITDPKMWFKKF